MLFPYTSDVDATKTFFRFLAAISKSSSVHWMLVSNVRTGLSTISFTPTAAARWNTPSTSSTNSAKSGASIMVSIR